MSISQETANLIETLCRAGATTNCAQVAGKIREVILDILPTTAAEDLEALRTGTRIQAENLDVLRGKLAEIHRIAAVALAPDQVADFEVIQTIMELAAPNDDAPEA